MRGIYKRYLSEIYSESDELLSSFITMPDDFNFGYDIIDDIALNDPDRLAMVWCNPQGEEHRFTFSDLKYWSDKAAQMFIDLGIQRGDNVLIALRRHYQFWFCALALMKIGAVMIPATFMLKEHDLLYRFQAGNIKAVISSTMGDFAQMVDNVYEEAPDLKLRILVDGLGPENGEERAGQNDICIYPAHREGWIDFNTEIQTYTGPFAKIKTDAHAPFLMYFSSGTTGNPKLIMHNSSYALAHICTAKSWHGVQSDGGLHFTIADTGWAKAAWGKLFGQWCMESCIFTYDYDRFDAHEILTLIERYGITTLCCPASMYRMLAKRDLSAYDLSSIKRCTAAGEALNSDLYEYWKETTGLRIYEGFGQSETALTIGNFLGMAHREGSMGKPSSLYTIELHDADDHPCAAGETGEVCIKMESFTPGIMMGYYGNPAKTAEAMRNGWYHTGDTAYYDEDGYLFYIGRNDDVIKSNGYRIGPFEIESVLLHHEAVAECAVTGVPDPLRGFAVKATIVLTQGFNASEELTAELQRWVKSETAPYKYPRIIEYVETLPKTYNGKIQRSAIRELSNMKEACCA